MSGVDIFDIISAQNCFYPSNLPILREYTRIPIQVVEDLFELCNNLKLGTNTRYLCYHLLHYSYPKLAAYGQALVCSVVQLACKLMETNHTQILKRLFGVSREIFILEKRVLKELNFEVQLPTLNDWISTYLDLVTEQWRVEVKNLVRYVCLCIGDLLYQDENWLVNYPVGLLIAGIIHSSVVILTKFAGKFPYVHLLEYVSGYCGEDIEIMADLILYYVLEDIYNQFDWQFPH